MENVMRFWIGMGCDGFRVDMAGSLIKNDADGSANIKLWQDFRHFLDENYPLEQEDISKTLNKFFK